MRGNHCKGNCRGNRRIYFLVFLLAAAGGVSAGDCFASQPDLDLELERPMLLAFGDVNNDGWPDLLAGYQSADKQYGIAVFLNRNGRCNTRPDRILKKDFSSPIRGIAVGDFDGDGKNDVAVGESRKNLWLFRGENDFEAPLQNFNTNTPPGAPLYAARLAGGNWFFFTGGAVREYAGGDKFFPGYIYPPEKGENNLMVVPANFDGDDEVALLGVTAKALRIHYGPFRHRNIRAADCAHIAELPHPLPVAAAAVGDFDGDGRLDIAVIGAKGGAVVLQDVPTGFSPESRRAALPAGRGLAAADLARRNRQELLVLESDKIVIYDNLKTVQTIELPGAYHLATGNFDGSGYPGLAAARFRQNKISLFNNQTGRNRP